MISVLLLILKIIGITLLVVLGLILLILLLVLFAPVSYKVWVVHNPKETRVKAKITYLFPLLSATLQYLKKFTCKVRLFGFVLFDSEKPKKEKPQKEKQDKKSKKKSKKKKKKATEEAASETRPQIKTETLPNEESLQGPVEKEETVMSAESEQEDGQEKKQGLIEKIKCKFQKIRETISNSISKIKKLLHQKDEMQRILAKPETKEVFSFAWDTVKRLIKHIGPKKIKGYVAYGADNPATTGQVLGVLSILYARTGKLLEIRPNFEEKQLECDVYLKGKIRLFTLLVIGIKVILHPELKQLIKEVKEIKNIE